MRRGDVTAVCSSLGLWETCSTSNDPPQRNSWEIAAAAALVTALSWWGCAMAPQAPPRRNRASTPSVPGAICRLVDGMLLDVCEIQGEDGRTLTMLMFSYRIGAWL